MSYLHVIFPFARTECRAEIILQIEILLRFVTFCHSPNRKGVSKMMPESPFAMALVLLVT